MQVVRGIVQAVRVASQRPPLTLGVFFATVLAATTFGACAGPAPCGGGYTEEQPRASDVEMQESLDSRFQELSADYAPVETMVAETDNSGQVDCGAVSPCGSECCADEQICYAQRCRTKGNMPGVIAVRTGHTCFLRDSGAVVCWGTNGSGSLATGTVGQGLTKWPPTTTLFPASVYVACGGDFGTGATTCALTLSGTAMCAGSGYSGTLGNGTEGDSWFPVGVLGEALFREIRGGADHFCAIEEGGKVWCWGEGADGALGLGSGPGVPFRTAVPLEVPELSSATTLDAGFRNTCAATVAGEVFCWGAYLGTLPETEECPVFEKPTAVESAWGQAVPVGALAVGLRHSCAALATGEVWCWGYDDHGQLGGEPSAGCHSTPELIDGVGKAVGICANQYGSCVVTKVGQVVCWGGELAVDGAPHAPEVVPGLSDVIALGCGSYHACALNESGEVWCWGSNVAGQLGVQGIEKSNVPVMVPGLN